MIDIFNPSYEDLSKFYAAHFSLGNLNTDIGSKFALISLICFLTHKVRMKRPDATCYQVIMKIIEKEVHLHDADFIRGLSIICEDFMSHTTEFLTFDIKTQKEMVTKILEILHTWLPF